MRIAVKTKSVAETERVGETLAAVLGGGAVVALYGGLGAGKTAFVRGMARGLGITARVSSPTFTIVNEYTADTKQRGGAGRSDDEKPPGGINLFHFDLYRVKNYDELFDIGWEDYLSRNGIIVTEWSENVPEAFDGTELCVKISAAGENTREITIEGVG